jgi:multiple sugar transport system ATP-binding protein
MAEVRISGLTVTYDGGARAVDDLSLDIEDGEFFALLGPSGCGKTTLLRTIAGLITPSSGRVEIGGRDVTRLAPGDRGVAMVFQDYALYPHMTVLDNIAYPLKVRHVPKGQRAEVATTTGDSLQLGELMQRRPGELSGGQQQRVALARAIASRAHVFLLDEPLSNLDARLRLEARTFLKRLQAELAVTTVYVTHDQAEALAMARRMAVMEAGVIRQVGSPVEVFQRPANLFVAQFTGSTPMNLLGARVEDGRLQLVGQGQSIAAPRAARSRLRAGDQVTVGIRPEYLAFSAGPEPGALRGRVVVIEHLGVNSLLTLEVSDTTLRAVVAEDEAPEVGAEGWLIPDMRHVLLYDPKSGDLIEPEPA